MIPNMPPIDEIEKIIKQHKTECAVCLAFHYCKDLADSLFELGVKFEDRKTDAFIITAPTFKKVIIPSKQRKPWSKRFKSGDRMKTYYSVPELYYAIVCSYNGKSKKWRRRRSKKGLRLLAEFNKRCEETPEILGEES